MKPGTPGFVGSRLVEAREIRLLTMQQLADLVGITRSAISLYENGKATPHPMVMRQLPLVLNVPAGFFFLPPRPNQSEQVFFRTKAATTQATRASGRHRLRWQGDIVAGLEEYLRLPAPTLPDFGIDNPRNLGDDEIEEIALDVRRGWGLGEAPIRNVIWLLEDHGAVVTRGDISQDQMDSFSRWERDDSRPLIFLNATKASAVRSRFDASHELGHLVLHRWVPEEYWGKDLRLREEQAHKFAGAFLLPSRTFCADVLYPSLDAFLALKPKWLVSISAMLQRATTLGLVPQSQVDRLWQNVGRRHWRLREPLDDQLKPEAPRLLMLAFEMLAQHARSAPSAILEKIQLPVLDVARLATLSPMFFEPNFKENSLFRVDPGN